MAGYSRVRDLREDADKTQADIAKMLNMQTTVYQRYERGERELPLWAAIKLADYYKVSLDYLVGRENIKKYMIEARMLRVVKVRCAPMSFCERSLRRNRVPCACHFVGIRENISGTVAKAESYRIHDPEVDFMCHSFCYGFFIL